MAGEIGADDPRSGGASLQAKLAHADKRYATALREKEGLARQLARQAATYQAKIRALEGQLAAAQAQVASMQVELDHFYGGASPDQAHQRAVKEEPPIPDPFPVQQPAPCVVDLCSNPAERAGYCAGHVWILDDDAWGAG